MVRRNRRVLRPSVDCLDERCLLSGVGSPTGFSPTQIKDIYGLSGLTFTSLSGQTVAADGTGETIAIVAAFYTPNLASDLHVFDTTFGLPDPALTQINLGGPNNINDGWASETTLDVEWAHAIAPGANIIVVEATSDATSALVDAINTARNTPGVVAISMSWGGPEMPNEKTYDSTFTTPAGHTGITFIAASGDTGAAGGAQWPASSPNVLSVGGTSLAIDSNGGYASESLWTSSGWGLSAFESEPAYQNHVQTTGRRAVPDVSFLGDPNTGVSVYFTMPSTNTSSWQTVGGTSLGTPAWAGIISIIDQGLALSGQGSLDGATQTLPLLYSLVAGNFHTVTNATAAADAGFHVGSTTISTAGLGTPTGLLITSTVHLALPVAQAGSPGTIVGGGSTSTGSTSGSGGTTTGGSTTPPNTGVWWPGFGTETSTGTGTTKGKKGKTKTPVVKKHPAPKPKPKPQPKTHPKANKGAKHAVAQHNVSIALAHSTGAGVMITSTLALNADEELTTPDLTAPAAFENAPAVFDAFEQAIQELANDLF